MKLKYILPLFLFALLFSSCSQSDDVIAIFTENGKAWKISDVFNEDGSRSREEWSDEEAFNKSEELRQKDGNFTIRFQGAELDGYVSGSYTGYASKGAISGKWTANGKNNTFTTSSQNAPSGEDVLGRIFANALAYAYKYEGDINNLRIYYTDPNKKTKKYIMLHVVSSKS